MQAPPSGAIEWDPDDDTDSEWEVDNPAFGGDPAAASGASAHAAAKDDVDSSDIRRNFSNWDDVVEEVEPGQVTAVEARRTAVARRNARRGKTLRRVMALLESEISSSLITLSVLLMTLIYESKRLTKGDDTAFGDSLKFRVQFALQQRASPLHEGWLCKQGEMVSKGNSCHRAAWLHLGRVRLCRGGVTCCRR
jgi:hypothetical protein